MELVGNLEALDLTNDFDRSGVLIEAHDRDDLVIANHGRTWELVLECVALGNKSQVSEVDSQEWQAGCTGFVDVMSSTLR